jgi:hypothetical protein
MNYNYLYIFLFTESRILRFTIRFYDSIREILLTIQGRIPILITLAAAHPEFFKNQRKFFFIFLYRCSFFK